MSVLELFCLVWLLNGQSVGPPSWLHFFGARTGVSGRAAFRGLGVAGGPSSCPRFFGGLAGDFGLGDGLGDAEIGRAHV